MLTVHNPGLKGVLFTLASTALFAPIFAAGKFADGDVPTIAIVMMRYLGGFSTVAISVLVMGIPLSSLKSPRPHLHLLRAAFSIGGLAFAIQAAIHMRIADASAIGLTEGLIVVALAAIILRERVTFPHWVAGCLCAFGAYIVISGTLSLSVLGSAAMQGISAAFASALCIACEALVIKTLARNETAAGVLLYVNGFAALMLIVPVYYMTRDTQIPMRSLLPFIILGPLAICGQYCNIKANRLTDVAILGPVKYSRIVFAAFIGVVLFNEVPDLRLLTGATFIAAGGIWLIRLSKTPQMGQ